MYFMNLLESFSGVRPKNIEFFNIGYNKDHFDEKFSGNQDNIRKVTVDPKIFFSCKFTAA